MNICADRGMEPRSKQKLIKYAPRVLLGLLALVLLGFIQSTDGHAQPSIEYRVENKTGISTESTENLIVRFLETEELHLGENVKENGETFFLAMGKAPILASPSAKSFIGSRQNAYDRAVLNAKAELVQYLRQAIRNNIKNIYKEPYERRNSVRIEQMTRQGIELGIAREIAVAVVQNPVNQEKPIHALSITGERFVRSELDRKLSQFGLDPSAAINDEDIERLFTATQISINLEFIAKERLTGAMVYKTFESIQNQETAEIAVLVIHSDRLHSAAKALYSGDTTFIPSGMRKSPIGNQMPKTKGALMSTFGAQLRADENGELVVLAYAQQSPRNQSAKSMNTAKKRALQIAIAQIRYLVAEIVSIPRVVRSSNTIQEYMDGMAEYQLDHSYRETVERTAGKLEIEGITGLRRWEGEHPLTKDVVTGIVVAWSPSQVNFAVD